MNVLPSPGPSFPSVRLSFTKALPFVDKDSPQKFRLTFYQLRHVSKKRFFFSNSSKILKVRLSSSQFRSCFHSQARMLRHASVMQSSDWEAWVTCLPPDSGESAPPNHMNQGERRVDCPKVSMGAVKRRWGASLVV